MVKCINLTYDSSLTVSTKFESITPTLGVSFVKSVPATDSNGAEYILYITEAGNVSLGTGLVIETSNYAVVKKDNLKKVLAYTTFVVPAVYSTGLFLEGTYESQGGSKIVVDSTPVRKFCVRL